MRPAMKIPGAAPKGPSRLPGTMRRIADITRRCNPECITRQRAHNTQRRCQP